MIAKAVEEGTKSEGDWLPKIADLKPALRGDMLLRGDAGYEDARRVWNGMIDRHPGAIVRCAGVADVIHTVRFAREHGAPVSVRGGGHNVAGTAVCDDGIVIDLSHMRGIRVDPLKRTVQVATGATWADVDRETQVFGLATTGGLVASTGIAGFTLGGGIGWLMRSFGLACDNLLSVDVVTADGRFLTASRSENADLFWGLKGGGGNFGVATSFEFMLHPIGTTVLGGALFFPAERAADFLRFYAGYVAKAPEELTTMVVLITAPPAPFLPPEVHGKRLLGLALCYHGSIEAGQKLLQPVRDFGTPVADLVGPMPYLALQSMFDEGNPPGIRNYWKSHYLEGLGAEAVETIVRGAERVCSPMSEVHVQHLGGAVARVSSEESSVAHRKSPFVLNLVGKWAAPRDDEVNIRWVREFWDAMRPHATGGVYVNFSGDLTEGAVKASYDPRDYAKLAALKAKYDPTNFFRSNHNIAPNGGREAPL